MTPDDRSLRAAAARLGAPGLVAAAVIASAAIASALMLPGLVGALLTPGPAPVALPDDAAGDHAVRMEMFRKQTDGRTMFFVPAKPPAPPVVVSRGEGDALPPPPPPPSTYGGPAPIGMVFDTVWFADGQKVKSGEEGTAGVKVVRLEPPWAAVLDWKGVEFTVKVFERDSVVLKAPGAKMVEGTAPEPRPTPPPEPPPGAAPAPPSDTPPGDAPADPPSQAPPEADPVTPDLDSTETLDEPPADPETNP